MTLAGARMHQSVSSSGAAGVNAIGEDELPGKVNYFVGNDPSRWRTNLPTYAKVRYTGVYPGVDLVYYGNQRQLEHDFVVAPNADPAKVELAFQGAKSMEINPITGDLILTTGQGILRLLKPLSYQESGKTGNRHIQITSGYKLLAGSKVGFSIGHYDHARPLIIDPVLVYSTFLGGTGSYVRNGYYTWGDQGNGIAVDTDGSAYIVGTTSSVDFPVTAGVYQTQNKPSTSGSGPTVFVSKLNATGTALAYSTYIGGSGKPGADGVEFVQGYGDYGLAIALDAANNAYISGYTYSSDFPVTAGAFHTTNLTTGVSTTAFVTKLSPDGSSLVYSTYLGGSVSEQGGGVAVDSLGNAYVTGSTWSGDFPVTGGAFQTTNKGLTKGASNAFVTKLNAAGTAEIYSTFLGGSGTTIYPFGGFGDQGNAIAVDGSGNAFITGNTCSVNFPVTAGVFQTVNQASPNDLYPGPSSGFVTKLNPSGTAEIYSTYLGGSPNFKYEGPYGDTPLNYANAIAIDTSGHAYIAGGTTSPNFPVTAGALETTPNSNGTGFISKLSPDAKTLEFSTYLGGLGTGQPHIAFGLDAYDVTSIAVDTAGDVFVAGYANSGDFPVTPDAIVGDTLQPQQINVYGSVVQYAFVAKLNPSATAVKYATLLGGAIGSFDEANALALDQAGNAYITGWADTHGFPITAGAFQTVNKWANGGGNAFVSELSLAAEENDHFPTETSIGVSSNLVPQGAAATLTATVTGSSGNGTPSGTATFFGAGLPATTVPLDGSGVATWSPTTLAPGPYVAYASYSGDQNNLSSSMVFGAPASFRVYGPPASLSYIPGLVPIYGMLNLPIGVRVSDSTGFGLAGITVNFSGAGLTFATSSGVTDANGNAIVLFTPLKAGTLVVSASVSGIATPLTILLNISPAPLTLSFHTDYRLYGQGNPNVPYTLSGLVGSDTVTVMQQTTAGPTSSVGIYPVTGTVGGAVASNYALTVIPGRVVVYKAVLVVKATSEILTYGQAITQPTGYTFTGFLNGDTAGVVSGTPVLSSPLVGTTPRTGEYPISIGLGTLSATNYAFELPPNGNGNGEILVNPAPLTVTADSLTMVQGARVPRLTYTATGFVLGDTIATTFQGAPSLTTTANSSSAPGTYPITVTGNHLYLSNYRCTFVNGVLTITP